MLFFSGPRLAVVVSAIDLNVTNEDVLVHPIHENHNMEKDMCNAFA